MLNRQRHPCEEEPNMTSTFLTLALLLPAAPAPAPKATLPKGPPPRIVSASIDSEGGFQLLESTTEYVQQQRQRTVVVGGQTQTVTETVMVPVMRMIQRKVDGENVEVCGVDGKKIDPDEVRKLAGKTLPVLVSSDGKPVDPFFLRLAREGTLVLVISAKEPKPVPVPKTDRPKPVPRDKD
jgi:hypothetical protein